MQIAASFLATVISGLVPVIHVFEWTKTWMAGSSSAKTRFALSPGHDAHSLRSQ